MHADTETGDISLESGTNIMLVARRDGKIVYIPLSAGGKDPEDETPDDTSSHDPCEHSGDGASADGGVPHGGGGGAASLDGGVRADGDTHTGDDNCNCD